MDSFVWKGKNGEIKINSLEELLNYLIKIKQEDIDEEIKSNLDGLIGWLESNFPKQIQLVAHLKTERKEYTSQQVRERIIRDLRTST